MNLLQFCLTFLLGLVPGVLVGYYLSPYYDEEKNHNEGYDDGYDAGAGASTVLYILELQNNLALAREQVKRLIIENAQFRMRLDGQFSETERG
jgi:hypothetical protein